MSPYVNKLLDLLGLSLIFINFCISLDLRLEDQLAIPINVVLSSMLMNISFYLDCDEPSICNMGEHVRLFLIKLRNILYNNGLIYYIKD